MLLVMLARDPVNDIRVVQVVRVEKVIVHPTELTVESRNASH